MRYRLLKIITVLLWICLLILLVRRDILVREMGEEDMDLVRQARREQYYGIWFSGKRIGYVVERLRPDPESTTLFLVEQDGLMHLKVAGTLQPVSLTLRGRLDERMRLHDFSFTFSSPLYRMQANGKVTGNQVEFSLDTGQTVIHDTVLLDRPPMLPLNRRPWLANRFQEVGEKRRVSFFDPLSLEPRSATIAYLGREKMLIGGRVHNVRKYIEQFSGMRTRLFTDDEGKIIKQISPAGFTFLAEPKFKATAISRSDKELLQAVSVPFQGKLPDPEAETARYRLSLPEGIGFDLDGGRQQWKDGVLTLSKKRFPTTAGNENTCPEGKDLQPERYIQSDDPLIRKTARDILGNEQDRARQVRLLSTFVYTTLKKQPVLGLPDALTSLKNKKGDCNEHAALFAALARAAGIPARIAAGVMLYNNRFYYHAWNEICLQGQWYSLDTTINQIPADLTHIRFSSGNLDQQVKIGSLLGNLRIQILPSE